MSKKAQDFLLDTALGEKSYEVKQDAAPAVEPEKIVLSIEEGGVESDALAKLKKEAKEKKESLFVRLNKMLQSIGKPQSKDKATFFRLLAVMINAGIPLIKSLTTIAEQTLNYRLKHAIYDIAGSIERGGRLSKGMEQYPDIFTEAHVGMIKSGEASGQLNQVLKQLAVEVEKSASIARKVRGAMMYPAFIVLVMVGVITVMMVLVVPKISEIFTQTGKELPTITRIVIGASNFMRMRWPIMIAVILALVIGFAAFRRTKTGKYATDWMFLRLPIFGQLLKKSILARFSRSLGNLLGSGIPIIQGLLINAKGLGNEIYKMRVELASEDISRGIPLAESLRDCPEFPTMMVQMISVGEQTAQLDTIAAKIAEYYEEEVDVAVAGISKVIEPVILVVVGVVVGGIIAAIMLPIVQISQMTGAL